MNRVTKRASILLVFVLVLAGGMSFFVWEFFQKSGQWVTFSGSPHVYENSSTGTGTVTDREGILLLDTRGERIYSQDPRIREATLHWLGDRQGNIGTQVMAGFVKEMAGFDHLNGVYAYGDNAGQAELTLSAKVQTAALQALAGRKGTVAVYNYKTGEILCMVSAPSYDPLAVPADIETNDRYEGAYLNRFLSATAVPGSVFKTVTLQAALEKLPDAEARTWECQGSVQLGEETIVCSGTHGIQSLADAFANSCNVAFAEMAVELGAETLKAYTEKTGLVDSYSVSGLPTAKSSFNWRDITDGQLGWAGVGQYHDRVNPCALMVYMGAIANGGKAAEAYLVEKTVSPLGISSLSHMTRKTGTLVQAETAEKLAELMAGNVEKTYGADRFPNMELCAKSGTAEVGTEKAPHAWFAGFLRNEEAPYAFVVLVENGGGGNAVAGTVAGRVLDVMVNGY